MNPPSQPPTPSVWRRLGELVRSATLDLPPGRGRSHRADVEGLDPVAVTGVAQMIVLALGALSCVLGPKYLLSILYLIPIAFAALRGGLTSGVITASTSTVVLLLINLWSATGEEGVWHHYWNAASRSAVFLIVAVLLTRSKELNHRLLDQTDVMSSEVDLRKRTEKISADEKDVLQQVANDRPLAAVLETLAQRIEQWHPDSLCAVVLFEGDAAKPMLVVAPGFPEELRRALQRLTLPEASEGAGTARVAGHVRALESLGGPMWEQAGQLASRFELYPSCGRGIVAGGGEWFGVLAIFARQRENGAAADSALFEKARDIAAIAIERARLIRELRRVSELVIDAQEAERRRIARELHDGVNQILSSAAFRIGMIEPQVPASAGDAREELARARTLLTRGIDEIHRISEDLRPSELDALGLVPAIRSLCREFQKKTRLGLRFECEPSSRRLPPVVELTVYRIVQEALTNIEKHSGATRADIQLFWDSRGVRLTVQDDGKGFAADAERGAAMRKSGMGLLNMRERTAFLGGAFSIDSIEGRGTVITAKIPTEGLSQEQQVA